MIMLDLLKIQETGKHIRKSKTKLLLTSNKLMMLTVITSLMLHILVANCKQFWSYKKNFRHDFSNIATLHVNNKELLTPSDKANALNDHFVSVFTRENSYIPKLPMNQYPIFQDIIFSTIGIKCILEKLYPNKSAGLDDITSRVLKLCAAKVSPFLQFIFTQSLNEELYLLIGSRQT